MTILFLRTQTTVLLFLTIALTPAFAAADDPPNVVILLADDLGYGELSCQNPDTDIPTPRIDSIAKNGVRFTNGYVTAPFCAASRAGMQTGRYQTRFGFEFNPTGPRNEDPDAGLPKTELTLADVLREEAGYTTALIGKWHLGGTAHLNPIRRGFDSFFGFLHEGHYFVPPPYDGVTTWLRRNRLPGGGEGRWTSSDGKLLRNPMRGQGDAWQLYDLAKDVGETDDRAAADPKKLAELLEQWESLNSEMVEPLFR